MQYFKKIHEMINVNKYLVDLQEGKVDLVKDSEEVIKEVLIHLTPLTASEEEKQYVSLTLVIKINEGEN